MKLESGKSYNAKAEKGCKYASSRPKIASVSQKGKIKAHKTGKCVIKVLKNKKCITKYKVIVNTKVINSNVNSVITPDNEAVNSSQVDMNNAINLIQDNKTVNSSQVDMNNTIDSSQDYQKVDIVPHPSTYGGNYIGGQKIMSLEKLESIDDISFYLYFNLNEWYNGFGKPAGYMFLKIRIDKTNDKGSFKDIEYLVGNKYSVNIQGYYTTDGDSLLYSEKCGLGISVASND